MTEWFYAVYITGQSYFAANVFMQNTHNCTTWYSNPTWSTDVAWVTPTNNTLWFDSTIHMPLSCVDSSFYMTTAVTPIYLQTNTLAGNVGIGISSPSFALDLGTAVGRTIRANLFSGSGSSLTNIDASKITGVIPANNLPLLDSTSSTSITNAATPNSVKSAYDLANNALPKTGGLMTGYIGINTGATAIIAPLQIKGFSSNSGQGYGGVGFSSTDTTIISKTLWASIHADGAVAATGFVAQSDIRIKQIETYDINPLDVLMLLNVIKYTYIDKVQHGPEPTLGFSAQNVNEHVPDAVTFRCEYIPNIFKLSDNIIKNNTIKCNSHGLVKNDKIKCIQKDNECIYLTCTQIIDDNHFEVDVSAGIDLGDEIFIYGSEVKDFHSLNYNHVFTLAVSGVQQLYKLHNTTQEKVQALEDKVTRLEMMINNMVTQ